MLRSLVESRRSKHSWIVLMIVLAGFLPGSEAEASGLECCRITTIDSASRTVTATDRATRRAFQFTLPAGIPLSTLEVGRTISADYARNRVLLDELTGCCEMIPELVPRFVPLCGGDCVKDRRTGYIWESTPAPMAQSLSQAASRCSSLNSVHRPADLTNDEDARERGWTIPYVWELATLPDPTLPTSTVPPDLFFNVQRELYWAIGGTSGGDLKFLARVFGTPSGGVGIVPSQAVNLRAWCVLSPWETGTVTVP
jgi:hypothetical protein